MESSQVIHEAYLNEDPIAKCHRQTYRLTPTIYNKKEKEQNLPCQQKGSLSYLSWIKPIETPPRTSVKKRGFKIWIEKQ